MMKPMVNQIKTLNDNYYIHINAGFINNVNTLSTKINKVNGNINVVVFDTQDNTFKVVNTSHNFTNLEYIGCVEVGSDGKTISFPDFDFSNNDEKQLLEVLPNVDVLDKITTYIDGKLYYCQAENLLAIGVGSTGYKAINVSNSLAQSMILRYRGVWSELKRPSRIYKGDIFNVKEGMILGSNIKNNTLLVANINNPISLGDFNEVLNITTPEDDNKSDAMLKIKCVDSGDEGVKEWINEVVAPNPATFTEFTVPYNMFMAPKLDYAFSNWLCKETLQTYNPGEIININTDITLIAQWKGMGELLPPVEFVLSVEDLGSIKVGTITKVSVTNITPEALISVESTDNIKASYENGEITIEAVSNGDINIKVVGSLAGHKDMVKNIVGKVEAVPVEFELAEFKVDNLEVGAETIIEVSKLSAGAELKLINSSSEIIDAVINDDDIVITGKSVGEFNLTVIASKEGMIDTPKNITGTIVAKPELKPVEFTLNPDTIADIEVGNSININMEGLTEGANVNVNVDNEEFATVTHNNGIITITGVKEGNYNLTVKASKEGMIEKSQTLTGVINTKVIPPIKFTLNPNAIPNINVGRDTNINIEGLIDGANVNVISDNEAIATASINDKVITIAGVKEGNYNITITASKEGMIEKSQTLTGVIEPAPVANVEFNINPNKLPDDGVKVGASVDINIEGLTEGANITATSGDVNIASAEVKGNSVTITGVKEGDFNLTISATKEGLTSKTITLKGKVVA